jgi:hypothetical protein
MTGALSWTPAVIGQRVAIPGNTLAVIVPLSRRAHNRGNRWQADCIAWPESRPFRSMKAAKAAVALALAPRWGSVTG